jgi:hypothetical protein
VIVATEPMDEDAGWHELETGQLLHVDGELGVSITTVVDHPPAQLMTLADLDPRAAKSQAPAAQT